MPRHHQRKRQRVLTGRSLGRLLVDSIDQNPGRYLVRSMERRFPDLLLGLHRYKEKIPRRSVPAGVFRHRRHGTQTRRTACRPVGHH